MVNALHLKAADACVIGIAQIASRAAARGLVCLCLAMGVRATNSMQTRICTFAMNTGETVRTILVLVALSWLGATLLSVTIADSAFRANATIRAGHIFALRTGMARLLRALINI